MASPIGPQLHLTINGSCCCPVEVKRAFRSQLSIIHVIRSFVNNYLKILTSIPRFHETPMEGLARSCHVISQSPSLSSGETNVLLGSARDLPWRWFGARQPMKGNL